MFQVRERMDGESVATVDYEEQPGDPHRVRYARRARSPIEHIREFAVSG